MKEKIIELYGERVGYTVSELNSFREEGHRIRHVEKLARVASKYSILAEVVSSRNCNSGHIVGQKFLLDLDGNFLAKHLPKKLCVYLASQLTIPVALINERLGEGLLPGDFHFMRKLRCPDVGVECLGYGEVMLQVSVVPRVKE